MKHLLIACSLVFSANVLAEVVVVKGYGKTYESALASAKIAAVEKVTGTWVTGEQRYKDGNYKESMVEYNGGVIKKYDVLRYDQDSGVIIIQADVDVHKDNRASSSSAKISQTVRQKLADSQEKYEKVEKSISYLNSPERAFTGTVSSVDYRNMGGMTQITINTIVTWTPKWTSDVEELGKTVGMEGRYSSNNEQRVTGALGNAFFAVNPLAVGLASVAYAAARPKDTEYDRDPMVCFADKKYNAATDCYTLTANFSNFNYMLKTRIMAYDDDDKPVFKHEANAKNEMLYEKFNIGDTKRVMGGYVVKYHQPTLAVYREEQMRVAYTFEVPTKYVKQVDRYEVKFY